jgi:uncharacterized protein (TIGR03437 family)
VPFTQRLSDGAFIQAVSAGEIVTLFGQSMGPDTPAGVEIDASGRISTETGGTRVLFDGIPAPLLYVSAGQVNAVVPWSVEGKASVEIEVEHNGQRSAAVELPVVEATPALFASDPWGIGQAAALNQDGTLNSRGNPAAPGSVIVLYATGLGPLDRPAEDGEIIPIGPPYPGMKLPISVLVDYSFEAEILYAGPAPGFVAGFVQINARIPNENYQGDLPPVVLRAGDFSGDGTGIAISAP